MLAVLVGGFDNEGKSGVIGRIVNRALKLDENGPITIILNDIGEKDLNEAISNAEAIQIEELRGGCVCCSMGSDLIRILKKNGVAASSVIVFEAAGTCDMRQLKESIKASDCASPSIQSYYVVDASTLPQLMEIIPIIKDNIIFSDTIILTGISGKDQDMVEEYIRLLREVDDDIFINTYNDIYIILTKKNRVVSLT